MSKLPIVGILVLMLLIVGGYVSSEETQAARVETTAQYADPHLNYYEEHLARIGLGRQQ